MSKEIDKTIKLYTKELPKLSKPIFKREIETKVDNIEHFLEKMQRYIDKSIDGKVYVNIGTQKAPISLLIDSKRVEKWRAVLKRQLLYLEYLNEE